MVMQKRYKGIANITSEDRELIQNCHHRWRQNRARPNNEDIKTLFAKYHEYVYHSPSDKSCPSCVQFVYDYWKGVVDGWG